jgi:uncharacterized protein YndB with AHSA1/START domain
MTSIPYPDLTTRPHELTVEREMTASPAALYRAWTEEFDSWFAQPGRIHMHPEEGVPFFFETEYEGARHPHYGRFLTLERDRLVELTWMTGTPGTAGAETVVTVTLTPTGTGTRLRLTHRGFYDEAGVEQHAVWDAILADLDERLST